MSEVKNINHAYIRRGLVTIAEVLPYISTLTRTSIRKYLGTDGEIYLVKMDTVNLKVFYNASKLECSCCGLPAHYFAIERAKKNKTPKKSPQLHHLKLFGVNTAGEEVMFTKDHIKPKSKGGNNEKRNLQIMCLPCNRKKGNEYESDYQLSKRTRYLRQSKSSIKNLN